MVNGEVSGLESEEQYELISICSLCQPVREEQNPVGGELDATCPKPMNAIHRPQGSLDLRLLMTRKQQGICQIVVLCSKPWGRQHMVHSCEPKRAWCLGNPLLGTVQASPCLEKASISAFKTPPTQGSLRWDPGGRAVPVTVSTYFRQTDLGAMGLRERPVVGGGCGGLLGWEHKVEDSIARRRLHNSLQKRAVCAEQTGSVRALS